MMAETLRIFFVVLFFLCIGLFAMGWARKIQQMHLNWLTKHKAYSGWVEGDIYISMVRFLGLFFLVMSVSMIFVRLAFPWTRLVVK